jgi:hypothetical protein
MYEAKTDNLDVRLVIRSFDPRPWLRPRKDAFFRWLRVAARTLAYVIAFFLSVVWFASGLASLVRPLFDLGTAHVGDAIVAVAGLMSLSPDGALRLAQMLAGTKLLLAAYLLTVVIVAAYQRLRRGTSDDAMLDVGLFLSAVASIVAVSPALMDDEALLRACGELLLCVLASGLAISGRGDAPPTIATKDAAVSEAWSPPPERRQPP